MNFTSIEFESKELVPDVSHHASVTIEDHESHYRFLTHYIAKNLVEEKGANLYTDILSKKDAAVALPYKKTHGRVVLTLGTGDFPFRTFDGEVLHALHHFVGKPVGTDCGVKVLRKLLIFGEGHDVIARFLDKAVEVMEATNEDVVKVHSWHIRYQYWNEEATCNKRPISSVVLPSAVKNKIVDDMTKFLSPRTKEFYHRNGIPFRRSYLFYGTPGTGKTSLVQALAGHFDRNICYLMPTHPEFTDDGLRQAVNKLPENSIVVFEDIDALFDKNRKNSVQKSALTFSGLLNALDGIGSSSGQIIVLTTNLRENLDHALIRNGRVDVHFEFGYAVEEQMAQMWCNFYPDAVDLAADFATSVITLLRDNELQVTTSALQHFFVTQMDSTPQEALSRVQEIVDDIRQNSSESMMLAASIGVKKTKSKKNKKEKNDEKNDEPATIPEPTTAATSTSVSSPVVEEAPQQPSKGLMTEAQIARRRAKNEKKYARKKAKRLLENAAKVEREKTADSEPAVSPPSVENVVPAETSKAPKKKVLSEAAIARRQAKYEKFMARVRAKRLEREAASNKAASSAETAAEAEVEEAEETKTAVVVEEIAESEDVKTSPVEEAKEINTILEAEVSKVEEVEKPSAESKAAEDAVAVKTDMSPLGKREKKTKKVSPQKAAKPVEVDSVVEEVPNAEIPTVV